MWKEWAAQREIRRQERLTALYEIGGDRDCGDDDEECEEDDSRDTTTANEGFERTDLPFDVADVRGGEDA